MPNRHEAILSNVYWLFNLNERVEEWYERHRQKHSTNSLQSQVSCLSAYSSNRLLYRSQISFIKPIIFEEKVSHVQMTKTVSNEGEAYRFEFRCCECWRHDTSNVFPGVIFQNGKTVFKRAWTNFDALQWFEDAMNKCWNEEDCRPTYSSIDEDVRIFDENFSEKIHVRDQDYRCHAFVNSSQMFDNREEGPPYSLVLPNDGPIFLYQFGIIQIETLNLSVVSPSNSIRIALLCFWHSPFHRVVEHEEGSGFPTDGRYCRDASST